MASICFEIYLFVLVLCEKKEDLQLERIKQLLEKDRK